MLRSTSSVTCWEVRIVPSSFALPRTQAMSDRKFKAQTFQLPNRHPDRMYMLAIDAARTSGFRDSLYYFRRNPLAMKLNATQAEKEYLIEVGKLGSHLRTRSVTMITARSAYKLHGAKMVQGVPSHIASPPVPGILTLRQVESGSSTTTTRTRRLRSAPRRASNQVTRLTSRRRRQHPCPRRPRARLSAWGAA